MVAAPLTETIEARHTQNCGHKARAGTAVGAGGTACFPEFPTLGWDPTGPPDASTWRMALGIFVMSFLKRQCMRGMAHFNSTAK